MGDQNGTFGCDNLLRIKYFGKTSFMLSTEETSLLLNPGIWDGEAVVPDDLDVRIIAVTNHLDDAVGNAAQIAINAKAWVLGDESTIEKVKSQGAKPWLLHTLENEIPYEIPGMKLTPYILKRTDPANDEKIENYGLHIEMGKMKVSYVGDSEIRGPFGALESHILITPIGGDGVFPVRDAVSICIDAHPKLAIPMRWEDHEQLKRFSKYISQFGHGITPLVMEPGQVLETDWAAGHEFRFTISQNGPNESD